MQQAWPQQLRPYDKLDNVAIVRTAPLNRGDGSSSERKICAPVLLQGQVLLKLPASACVQSNMSLAL